MPEISKITLPSGSTYDLADSYARELIENLEGYTKFLGVTTTALADGATTNPITVNGESVTAHSGDIANYGSKEFIFNGTTWQEFGDLSGLGTLAYKNSVAVTTKATGTVSQPTFTGSSTTSTGTFTPAGSVSLTNTNRSATVSTTTGEATYTPAGSCSGANVTLNTTTVNSITNVGSLPTFTVANETLTITAGTLPTKGANTTVATSIDTITQPTFTGTGTRLVTDNIAVPSSASFTGTEGNVSVSGTPTGTVSQPTFTGNDVSGTVTYSPS